MVEPKSLRKALDLDGLALPYQLRLYGVTERASTNWPKGKPRPNCSMES